MVENIVKHALGKYLLKDLTETSLGWICYSNKDIKIGAKYLISFNYATEVDEFDYISQFINHGNPDKIRAFYRQTNGMKILSNRFVVPGVSAFFPDLKPNSSFNVPYDFQVSGGILLPKHAPVDGFQIGSGNVETKNGTIDHTDIMDDNGVILSGYFHENDEVIERFDSIEAWITSRITQAKARFREEEMN